MSSGIPGFRFGGPMWNRAVTTGKNNENNTSLSKDTPNNPTQGGTDVPPTELKPGEKYLVEMIKRNIENGEQGAFRLEG